MKKKFLALVLTLSMVLSLVPMTALAAEGDQVDTVAAGSQSAGEDANGSNQEGGSNADSDSTPTGESSTGTNKDPGANPENKGEGKDSGSKNTGETTPEGGENTPIGVPEGKLIFKNGVIEGINATWLAEKKDKPLSVAIPPEIGGVAVTTIGPNAFNGKKVVAVDFSNATKLEKIDNQAFMHSPVTSVDLSNTKVTTIGKFAFDDCTSLETFIFPDTLTSLGNSEGASVFKDCKSLKVMRLANSPKGVVFALPETLTYIGKDTFKNCFADGVEAKVVIPASVTTINGEAFKDIHITQIVLKSTDVSGYHNAAFDFRSGSSRMLVFANETAYDNYMNSKPWNPTKKAMTYPVEITFEGASKKELHLNGKPLGYQQDNTTGFWKLNDAYALPTAPGSGTPVNPKPGYEYVTGGGWKLRENDEVLDVKKDLKADKDKVTAVSGGGKYELLAPTISYLVDGESKPVDAAQPFTVTIGDKKEHSIGILVDHPLLKEKKGTDEDYVYFEYYWFDEVALGGGPSTLNGPRSKKEPGRFSTATSNVDIKYVDGEHNTIPITEAGHARYEGSSHAGYNDYYLVEVFGYHVVDGDTSTLTPFYHSANNGIGVGSANVTDRAHLLQVKVDEVRIITATADDNGKITPAGGVPVPLNGSQTFQITPDDGYHIQDVKVDDKSVGAVKEYTFKDVTEPHTIHATFARNSSGGSHKPTVTIPDDVPTGLNGKDHYAYVVGYPDGMVYPQKNITRAEVATIFFRLLKDETREANMTKSNSYNDMKDGAWYTCAVSTLSKMGIIKGYEDGSFKPDASISRAEFAAIAARFDPDGDKTPATFSDVSSHWAKDEISIAANHGWIKGYEDGSFKPDQKITRAETMTLVNRVLKRLPETKDDLHKDMKTWPDNQNESAWFYLAVQEATNSHYQKLKKDGIHETWESMRETRDWAALEK